MTDDLFSQLNAPAPARAPARRRVRAACGHWVYPENLVHRYGETCAERLGLATHRWRLTGHGQEGADLFTTYPEEPDVPVTSHHRGVVYIDEEELARLLRLPDGQAVLGLRDDFTRQAIAVLVEGPGLPEVPVGTDAPEVHTERRHRGRLVYLDARESVPGIERSLVEYGTPAEQHAAVVAELEATLLCEPRTLAGQLRIVNRHRPEDTVPDDSIPGRARGVRCQHCAEVMSDMLVESGAARWPCAEFRDAAGPHWPHNPDGAE